jgi:hypothetical protein
MHSVSSPVGLLITGATTYLCLSLLMLRQVVGILPNNEPCQILMVIQLFSKKRSKNTASKSPCHSAPKEAISRSAVLRQQFTNKNKHHYSCIHKQNYAVVAFNLKSYFDMDVKKYITSFSHWMYEKKSCKISI